MILITGGLGFIGSHTTRALLDLGEPCLLVQRRAAARPATLANAAGPPVFAEQVDITDRAAFLDLGRRHRVTSIVHLAGSVPWPPDTASPVDAARTAVDSLLTVLQAAQHWGVRRVSVASTIGVYAGLDTDTRPLREDTPLPMTAGHAIPAFKKIGEMLTDHLANATGIPIINLRIAAVWGPLGRPTSVFFPAPQLVHAAVRGTAPDLSALHAGAYADNGNDLCYVKDCAQAIAQLHLAGTLHHRTYNIASGCLTTNREFADAVQVTVPGTSIHLPDGRDPHGPAHDPYLDITRIHQDTGWQPHYDTQRAVADYVAWLRAGNPR